MRAVSSPLDRPTARAIAAAVGLSALAGAGWLICLRNRQDPALAACIKRYSLAIESARDKGALPQGVAARFLAHVAQSCAAQVGRRSR